MKIFINCTFWIINPEKFFTYTVKGQQRHRIQTQNYITINAFNVYKRSLWKVVDGIQIIRYKAEETGKTPDIEEAIEEISKTMSPEEKEIINNIKKTLNWK